VVGVLVVTDASAAGAHGADHILTRFDPTLDHRRLVLAETEPASDRRRGQRRTLVPPAHAEAVNDAAPGTRRLLQVQDRLVDDRAGYADAGVPGGPQRLHLRDRHRPFIEVIAFHVTTVGDVAQPPREVWAFPVNWTLRSRMSSSFL